MLYSKWVKVKRVLCSTSRKIKKKLHEGCHKSCRQHLPNGKNCEWIGVSCGNCSKPSLLWIRRIMNIEYRSGKISSKKQTQIINKVQAELYMMLLFVARIFLSTLFIGISAVRKANNVPIRLTCTYNCFAAHYIRINISYFVSSIFISYRHHLHQSLLCSLYTKRALILTRMHETPIKQLFCLLLRINSRVK